MRVLEEEIFGPLLPIKTYKEFGETIDYVNGKPRPLAVYYFGEDSGEERAVLIGSLDPIPFEPELWQARAREGASRLGAARSRLDVEVGILRVHFAGEHAAELEPFDPRLEAPQVPFDFGRRGGVVFLDGKGEQLVRIPQPAADLVQPDDDLFQPGPLLAERLRALRLVPDVRLFQLALDLGQPLRLLIVVKDTSSTRPRVQ